MNNEMCLRTNQGEYTPGDEISGAVYLHIACPTEAFGIHISFKAVEKCVYDYDYEGKKKSVKNETVHVDIHQAELYTQQECFQFGCYVFPFRFELPQDAPGTFHYKGSSEKGSWAVDISYRFYAHAEGSDALQASQSIVVYQATELALSERSLGCFQDATIEVSRLPLLRKSIHLTVRLIENYVETGKNMQLRLVVTNPTKLKVTGFHVKVLRYFRLFIKDSSLKKNFSDNMEMVEDLCHIAPESGPHAVLTIAGSSNSVMSGNAGLDRFQLPLREKLSGQTEDLAPSVSAKHVSNRYGIEVSISFSNNHTETLTLAVPGVLPRKNAEWSQWKPPDWVYNAETKLSSSHFSVPHQVLRTEAFAGLPSFHVL